MGLNKKTSITVLFIFLSFIGCKNKNAPLYKAIEDIEKSWTEEEKNSFKNMDIFDAQAKIYFNYALYYRNNVLRNSKDSSLVNYFHELEVYDYEYMSGIVFTSLHRKLNGKPIDLEEQLKLIFGELDSKKIKENKNTKRALKYYKHYNEKDTITVRMPVYKNTASRDMYPEDSNWIHNDSLDLLLRGVIIHKYELIDTLEIVLEMKVLSMNRNDIDVLMEKLHIGDTLEVDLKHDIIE